MNFKNSEVYSAFLKVCMHGVVRAVKCTWILLALNGESESLFL